jgi:hypothetical protein
MTQDTQALLVTQADRYAAAPYMGFDFDQAKRGKCDNHPLVQAFARHRIAHQPPAVEGLREAQPDVGAPTPEPSLDRIVFGYYAEHFDADKAQELTDAYFTTLASLFPVEGWRLVPVEPTQAMIDAGWNAETPEEGWAAMLSAAPQAPNKDDSNG